MPGFDVVSGAGVLCVQPVNDNTRIADNKSDLHLFFILLPPEKVAAKAALMSFKQIQNSLEIIGLACY